MAEVVGAGIGGDSGAGPALSIDHPDWPVAGGVGWLCESCGWRVVLVARLSIDPNQRRNREKVATADRKPFSHENRRDLVCVLLGCPL